MRDAIHDRYGPPDVLRIADVERPLPKEDELLVRVHAAAVNRTDCGYRGAHPFFTRFFTGLRRPKQPITGSEFAGVVEATGPSVTQFKVGDRVFGSTGFRFGAHAEYLCVRESARVALMPDGLSFEHAAAVPEGAIYALGTLRSGALEKGQRILIYGASGAIGTASVQLAKHHFGAHVTAVCSTRNVDVVRSLGPDHVIDYTAEDFTESGQTYDVIHDAVGKHSFRRCRRALALNGIYISNDLGFLWHLLPLAIITPHLPSKKALFPVSPVTTQDFLLIRDLVAAGHFRPVLDRTYPLEQIVEASRYVETARKTGNVVITTVPSPST